VNRLVPLAQLIAQNPGLEVRREQRCQVEGEALILQAALERTAVVRVSGARGWSAWSWSWWLPASSWSDLA
jgi:hypothetical protein